MDDLQFDENFCTSQVTWLKSTSVIVSIAGVVMVSVAPQHTDSSDTHPSLVGYLWLMVSVLAYASYEVFQKRFIEPHDNGVVYDDLPSVLLPTPDGSPRPASDTVGGGTSVDVLAGDADTLPLVDAASGTSI